MGTGLHAGIGQDMREGEIMGVQVWMAVCMQVEVEVWVSVHHPKLLKASTSLTSLTCCHP